MACKVFKEDEVFLREVEFLEILKESMRRHDRILLHLATIIHGSDYIIVLPLARHGDLTGFLHPRNHPRSCPLLDSVKCVEDIHLHESLLQQMCDISDAVNWLHTGLSVPKHRSIYAAHFDLKPDNIMIEAGPTGSALVGQWVLSDFGLSVLEKETGKRDDKLHSIGDTASHFSRAADHSTTATINVEPKRFFGTYQPPEAEERKQAGRRSDVWSLTCVSSEVLAFAKGRTEEVDRYQKMRASLDQDDMFYSKNKHSSPQVGTKYVVRPAVRAWLDETEARAGSQEWLRLWVDVTRKCLTTDRQRRPGSDKLKSGLGEALEKLQFRATPRQRLEPARTSPPSHSQSGLDRDDSNILASPLPSEGGPITPVPSNRRVPVATHSYFHACRLLRTNDHHCLRAEPVQSHHVINCEPWGQVQRSGPVKVSIANGGDHIAWLLPSVIRVDRVLDERHSERVQEFSLEGGKWRSIAIAGSFVAAWGFCEAERQVKVFIFFAWCPILTFCRFSLQGRLPLLATLTVPMFEKHNGTFAYGETGLKNKVPAAQNESMHAQIGQAQSIVFHFHTHAKLRTSDELLD